MTTSPTAAIDGPKYLFGAGGAGFWALQGFRREGIAVQGFLDDAAASIGEIAGLPVLEPDSEVLPVHRRKDATVIFSIMNPAVSESSMRERLLSLGWGNVMSFGEFGRDERHRTGRRCSMLDPHSFESHTDQLAAARALLSDEHSQQLFDAFVAFVCELDESGFPEITPAPYFPADLQRWEDPLRMIDCGAFDGDSVRDAIKYGYNIEAAISFEPDPGNFAKLATNINKIPGSMAWPCGVSDRTATLKFAANGDTGSAVSKNGDISIQAVALDDAIPHFAPNFIKLDIEGSEQAALKGAENIIRRYRPGLAVSVYHLPTDLWQIALYLATILERGCRYYLRRHSRTIADTVLYVQPER